MSLPGIACWPDIELKHLFYAYRKAKADCFFERSIVVARDFAEYERELPTRLSTLLVRLQAGNIDEILLENLGEPRIVAKKLGIEENPRRAKRGMVHGYFSSAARAFDRLCETHELTPEFRLVGNFPVDMHVLSALWINLVGHKFDARLDESAFGARLRRYRPAADSPQGTVGDYHIEAVGSFQPYFVPYKTWRAHGMTAIRGELDAGRAVIAISMDLTSYYHRIDPCFLSDEAFHRDIGIDLSAWEGKFTQAFAHALEVWSNNAASLLRKFGCDGKDTSLGGLPIGLSMVRVASNVLLRELDRDIKQGLAPVYYGRYIDDIFLVIRDPGHVNGAEDLLRFVAARTESFPQNAVRKGEVRLKCPGKYWGRTSLLLQQSKQKIFFLDGRGGLDFLDNIEAQILSVSSERRLMPAPGHLEKMASAQVLTAAASAADEADTLRRADGLSVRRLGWSIQLRAVETLARDLRSDDWLSERRQFYEFAHNHVLRPDRILDHVDYLPRLLSLAVALTDWPDARRMVDAALRAVDQLELNNSGRKVKINGIGADSSSPAIWHGLRASIMRSCADAIARSLRWSRSRGGMRQLSEAALSLCEKVGLEPTFEGIEALSLLMRESDWAKTPYKDHLRRDAKRQRPTVADESVLYGLYTHELELRHFLALSLGSADSPSISPLGPHCEVESADQSPSLLPYLVPTRPYTTGEISLFLPKYCALTQDEPQSLSDWAKFVRAVRGIWVWINPAGVHHQAHEAGRSGQPSDSPKVTVHGRAPRLGQPLLGISSLLTTDVSFRKGASGKHDISPERYLRLKTIVDQAIQSKPKPTYLLLPELALPERWIDTVSGLLADAGINLISGLDYFVEGSSILSEAVLVLSDSRLGFPSTTQIRQTKALPAASEEEQLLHIFGKTWQPGPDTREKPVYFHNGFSFGILVCSELQNIAYRECFQGNVDCVMVLSWNQDLETFAALVESASLDVHAFIALVNNRKYGDSRVRSPAKVHYERDLCRLRGGENEHLVVVELDIYGLRAFQSREKRWPRDDDPFKPVPEGFLISAERRVTPK